MTRTARSTFPRALIRDRSESKSGLDKSLRKGGGGHHNWGSIADEGYLEAAALEDEQVPAVHEDRRDSRTFITAFGCSVAHVLISREAQVQLPHRRGEAPRAKLQEDRSQGPR